MKNILRTWGTLSLIALLITGCKDDTKHVLSDRNDMLEFSITPANSGTYDDPANPGTQLPNFYKSVNGEISGDKIIVQAPYYAKTWDGLKPTFSKSDRAIVYLNDEVQISGSSKVDFANPVTYRVVSEKGDAKDYIVEFYKEKPFWEYAILAEDNPDLSYDTEVVIDSMNRTIIAELPPGSSLTGKIARFSVPDDVTVHIGQTPQTSGVSVVDFTSPVEYTLSSSDPYPETWTVVASVHEPSSENDFLTFNFSTAKNPDLFADIYGSVNTENHTIRVASYWTAGMNPLPLIPDFTTSKYVKKVVCNGVDQTSGSTSVDFAQTVTYTITADDGTTQDWKVTLYKPTKFYIPDRYFRKLVQDHYSNLMEGDSLLIEKAIADPLPGGTDWWGDGMRSKDELPIADFRGIEFFQSIPTLGIPGVQLGSTVLDLRKNTKLSWIVYWNGDIETIDISGLHGNNGAMLLQVTAGKTPPRIIARDVVELNYSGTFSVAYLDYRGLGVNNLNSSSNMTFKEGAKLLMTKSRWEVWVLHSNPCVPLVKGSQNMTLELWNDEGTAVVETLVFN